MCGRRVGLAAPPPRQQQCGAARKGLVAEAQYADVCLPAPPEAREDNVRVIISVISAVGRTQLFMCHCPGSDATRQVTGGARREVLQAKVTRLGAWGLHDAAVTGAALFRCCGHGD